MWHLGSVYAAGFADLGFNVIGFDSDSRVISKLSNGQAPLYEPGLDDLLNRGMRQGLLTFTSDQNDLSSVDLLMVAYDTPVDQNDRADFEYVKDQVRKLFPVIKEDAVVLICSQVPVGTTRQIADRFASVRPEATAHFAYSPENLRLGSALKTFFEADRFVIGTRHDETKDRLLPVLSKLDCDLHWVGVESAEMTKHALNAFLAMSVVFSNEIAKICELVGADASEVEVGLKSDGRIGTRAYLRPGPAYAGGTLARDISALIELERRMPSSRHFFLGIEGSNSAHRSWAFQKTRESLGDLAGKDVAILGMTYKPGTDTLRRSEALTLALQLAESGANVTVYDPFIKDWSREEWTFNVASDIGSLVRHADALVVSYDCQEFSDFNAELISKRGRPLVIIDTSSSMEPRFRNHPSAHYLRLGKHSKGPANHV